MELETGQAGRHHSESWKDALEALGFFLFCLSFFLSFFLKRGLYIGLGGEILGTSWEISFSQGGKQDGHTPSPATSEIV